MGAGLPQGSGRGGRGRRGRYAAGGFNEINVTPFVDVMLVLLIIFMVAAPMMTTGVTVDLPKAKATAVPGSDEPLSVTIRRDTEPRARAVPVELPLADHLAERRAVEQPREFAGLELARVNRHQHPPKTSPSRATRRSARG